MGAHDGAAAGEDEKTRVETHDERGAAEMNALHRWLCGSSLWKNAVERHMFPWVLEDVPLGPHVLEVGPGPGVTTELLRPKIASLTCVEIDCGLAQRLSRRMAGREVSILCADATAMPLTDGAFDTALSFTMLHHVPSTALQDRLLAEVARVLPVGGGGGHGVRRCKPRAARGPEPLSPRERGWGEG